MAAALKCCFSFRTNEQTDKRGNGLGRLLVEYGMKHCGVKSVTVNENRTQRQRVFMSTWDSVYIKGQTAMNRERRIPFYTWRFLNGDDRGTGTGGHSSAYREDR